MSGVGGVKSILIFLLWDVSISVVGLVISVYFVSSVLVDLLGMESNVVTLML